MAHDPHAHDRREVIVERGRGGGPGAIIAAIVAVVLLALLVWFLFTNFLGSGQRSDTDVNVPERIDVNVDEQGGQGGQGGQRGGS